MVRYQTEVFKGENSNIVKKLMNKFMDEGPVGDVLNMVWFRDGTTTECSILYIVKEDVKKK